ncbi:MAG: clostripain-related cysteine peptidase [Gammaproteobacteria bacterium]|nr:clostripain-related cysteine peptidase [Gammaproteobacteria bacterium]
MRNNRYKVFAVMIGVFFAMVSSIAHATDSTKMKEWTFLIFLNGNNNLDKYGMKNLKDMQKVGSNEKMNVVVQWASEGTRETKRVYVNKGSLKTLDDMGLVDMGNVDNLKAFIEWGVKNYPAKHYFIDVWNHGSGWHDVKTNRNLVSHISNINMRANDISFDELSGHAITTEQLGQALQFAANVIGHPVDIYGSDACLMGMAEVANEMSGAVNYFVGSEEVEPGDGWPYDTLLTKWQALPEATPSDVAKILVNAYADYYKNNPGEDVTMAAYDMSKLTALNDAVTALGADLRTLSTYDRQLVMYAVGQSQHFKTGDYVDLRDLTTHFADPNLKAIPSDHLEAVNTAINDLIIANATTDGLVNAHGISIWLPTDESTYKYNEKRYQNLVFNNVTQWNKTLQYLLQGAAFR